MTAETKLILYSVALETAAIASLFKGPYFLRITSFLTLHAAACAISAGPACGLLPEKYRHPRVLSLSLIFSLLFTVSLAGFAGLAFFTVYLMRSQKNLGLVKAALLNQDRLDSGTLSMPGRGMGEGAIKALCTGAASSPQARMRTVMMISEISSEIPKHVRLLKESIKSPDDSVRMFSFSMVDSMEKRLNDQIHSKLALFRDAHSAGEKAPAARELASLYWEYVYTGLADKEYRDIMTREAENYALLAMLHLREDPMLLSLMGRICLSRRRYDDALKYFREAMSHCRNPDRFRPYIAEILYIRRDYAAVRETFRGHSGFTHDPALVPIVQLWTAS
ncbi:MAG: tetratricopeptide repeat protein [Elusimicrobiales bacterium]